VGAELPSPASRSAIRPPTCERTATALARRYPLYATVSISLLINQTWCLTVDAVRITDAPDGSRAGKITDKPMVLVLVVASSILTFCCCAVAALGVFSTP
jgi:hypothetical protein